MNPQRPHFSPYSIQLKPIIETQISGKLVSSGISNVAFTLVSSDKIRLKKLMIMIIIIIMILSQETTVLMGASN